MTIPEHLSSSSLWKKWEMYSAQQKEAILEEFRRKLPDDHFDKRLLVRFLREKHQLQPL